MSVAFPIALGVALAIGTLWDFTSATQVSWVPMSGGTVLLLAAVVSIAMAHSWRLKEQRKAAQAPLQADPRVKSPRSRQSGAALAVVLASVGGIALSVFPRVLSEATSGENGLAPYSAVLLLSISVLLSAPFFVLFFITFPVAGAGTPGSYLTGNKKQHLLGLTGGILWTAGLLASLLAAVAPITAQPSPVIQYSLSHGAVLVAAVWGLLAWQEFRGTGDRVRMLVMGMLVLLLGGLGVVAFAFSVAK
jgi:glucose uptake protein